MMRPLLPGTTIADLRDNKPTTLFTNQPVYSQTTTYLNGDNQLMTLVVPMRNDTSLRSAGFLDGAFPVEQDRPMCLQTYMPIEDLTRLTRDTSGTDYFDWRLGLGLYDSGTSFIKSISAVFGQGNENYPHFSPRYNMQRAEAQVASDVGWAYSTSGNFTDTTAARFQFRIEPTASAFDNGQTGDATALSFDSVAGGVITGDMTLLNDHDAVGFVGATLPTGSQSVGTNMQTLFVKKLTNTECELYDQIELTNKRVLTDLGTGDFYLMPRFFVKEIFHPPAYRPIVVFSFDDSNDTDYNVLFLGDTVGGVALPSFASFGWSATSFVIANSIDKAAKLTTTQMRSMASNGWDFQVHYAGGSENFAEMTTAEIRESIKTTQTKLKEAVGSSADIIAYSEGRAYDSWLATGTLLNPDNAEIKNNAYRIHDVVKERGIRMGRNVGSAFVEGPSFPPALMNSSTNLTPHPYLMFPSILLDTDNGAGSRGATQISALESMIRLGQPVIFFNGHRIVEDSAAGPALTPVSELLAVMNRVAELEQQGVVSVMSAKDAYWALTRPDLKRPARV